MATLPDFVEAIVAEFPELRAEVEDYPGLPYIQVGSLANLAQRAKGAQDWETYRRVVELIDRFIEDPNPDLSNAIHVSVLEHLDFIGPRGPKAWSLVPPNVQLGWRSIMDYNEKLLGQPRPEGRVKPWEQPNQRLQLTAARKGAKRKSSRRG
jgi:hypothetical protein